eukprot:scaffold190032_cov35-Tisochrysis_lutea.AAC.1
MVTVSAGEILNNALSKWSMYRKKPPWRTLCETKSKLGGVSSRCQRSVGTIDTALLLVIIINRRLSCPRIPSGNDILTAQTLAIDAGVAACTGVAAGT